ncbi:MAG: OmpA family protein, partial [Bacteroidetes bacterium]|nr:OmpA family protein [Bacteroidota bacterium]
WAQAGKQLIINHFVSDPAVIEGHLVISDVQGRGGTINVVVFDEKGNQIGNATETIPAGGKLNINAEKYVAGRTMVGTLRISSTVDVAGQYWQFYKDSKLGWKNIAVPAAVGPGATKLVCQHFVADPAIESYLVVADAEGTGPTVYVEFYNDQGELAGQKKIDVPRNGKFSIQPLELVGGKKMTGVAHIQTEGGKITGEYWQVSEREKYQIAHAMQGSAPVAEVIEADPMIRVQVQFDFDSDKIQKRSYADLMEVARAMNGNRNRSARYEIGGHTDNVGKEDYNMKLSERRAQSVKKFLVDSGVDASRLLVVGYGPKQPLVPNDTPAQRAINRRVEFKKL